MKIALLLSCFALSLAACGDDTETLAPSCETLHTACASFHDDTGPGHDCHEVAEANDAAQCTAQLASCMAACSRDMSVAHDIATHD